MTDHLAEMFSRYPALQTCRAEIEKVFALFCDCYRRGGKVLVCGNGGSAADAEHWAGELLKGFESRRPLSAQERAKLPPELAAGLQGSLPMIPLTGFAAMRLAVANDVDPRFEFAQLVWGLGAPGDLLIGISTSGNAQNVCFAVQTAKAKGMRTVGMSGATGGKLSPLVEVCIRAPETNTRRIQELHLPVYHALSLMVEDEFFPASK